MTSIELEKKLKTYRLNFEEYQKIETILGRAPQGVEWAIFSALWSEHCSYKSSKIHLRKFNYKNKSVLESEGENAGIVDLGLGEKIAFKMESHNHPSFIEPFQGAATGVGGILRDIFTMGARPIALADYLCFGEPTAERMDKIASGVVHGISSYGNCVGVPTINGQTEYHSEYNKNVLVNAMAVGLLTEKMKIAKSGAQGPGNLVVYVGAKTGKDGVHGASMASESFGENLTAKKPNVQIGDPFFEKLLIEACLEVIEQELVVAMQDMGAAGLTSSSFEMSAKGELGITLDLSLVPLRDQTMNPEEILLSESQERMLLICKPEAYKEVQKAFAKWGLDAVQVGVVKSDKNVEIFWKNEKIFDLDPNLIVEKAPRYDRKFKLNIENKSSQQFEIKDESREQILEKYKKSYKGQSKNWIINQYDQRVGLRTARDATQSVGLQCLPSKRGLAISVGCRPSVMKINARLGALDAVFYPTLQMALKGARALAVTDCLNFGNPEKIEVMSDFVTSIESIAEASRILDAPVISGNVSFYNETLSRNIIPTPATGLVGLRSSVDKIPWDQFQKENETVFWLKANSALADFEKQKWQGQIDLVFWKKFIDWILEGSRFFKSSKAVGEGGLWATLWQMSQNGIGFDVIPSFTKYKVNHLTPFYESVISVEVSSEFEKWKNSAPENIQVIEIGKTKI